MRRFLTSRLAFVLLLVVLVTGLPLVTFVLITMQQAEVRPPPLRYLARPVPLQQPVCPLELIPYSFRFEVDATDAPVALTIDRGIWSTAEGRFVVSSVKPATYPYNRSATISRTSTFQVPELMDSGQPFPPGKYELMVTGESEGRETVGFVIPFEIRPGC